MQVQSEPVDMMVAIRRQKKAFIITFMVLFIGSVIIAMTLPAVYKSEAMILIESQQIPENYVQSAITSYVDERIEMITQQVMSWSALKEIIDAYNPYPEMGKEDIGDMIGRLRKNTKLETISAVVGKSSGPVQGATVAFKLSYEGHDPETVQKVTSELSYLYIREDLKNKEKVAFAATDFLSTELEKLKTILQQLETQISDYKSAHIGELPENTQGNVQALDRAEREYDRIQSQLRAAQERKLNLETEIATIEPLKPVVMDGRDMMMNPAERLKRLRLELVGLKTTLSDKHPDIKKIKREIAELEAKVGARDDVSDKLAALQDMEGRLAKMKGELGLKHPDVIRLEKTVRDLSREVNQSALSTPALAISAEHPDNPLYISLKTQIAALDIEIRGLQEDLKRNRQEMMGYQRKVDNAPSIEEKYVELTRDYSVAKGKYGEIWNKLMSAKVSKGMEEAQRGERFTIKDPAYLPKAPYKPNRLLLVLMGFALSIGGSVGMVAFREYTDNTIKSIQELKVLTNVPVFSTLSAVETAAGGRSRRRVRLVWGLSMICLAILILALVDHFLVPLENLVAQVAVHLN
jgi:polysaccharide biosynthesis transport protein